MPGGDAEHICENLTHRRGMFAYIAPYIRLDNILTHPRMALGAGTVAEKQLHHIARVALAGVVKGVVVFLRAERNDHLQYDQI